MADLDSPVAQILQHIVPVKIDGHDCQKSSNGHERSCDRCVSGRELGRDAADRRGGRVYDKHKVSGGRSTKVPAVADLDLDSREALKGVTTSPEECAEDVSRTPGTPCASRRVIKGVVEFAGMATASPRAKGSGPSPAKGGPAQGSPTTAALPTAPTQEAVAVRSAAEMLGCNSESCVLVHPSFRQFVVEKGLVSEEAIDGDLETRFKTRGPRHNTALLSNVHIDETLRRWARIFPEFFPCPFAMMDFDRTREPFATIDIKDVLAGRVPLDLGPGIGTVRRPAKCFGCVVNTDTSSGPGKHWVAVFVDCRPPAGTAWTVEYFNSAGRPPPKPMVQWMERTRARISEYRHGGEPAALSVPVTSMDHQESQTECGLYALFYIRRRLEGVPYGFFFEQRVPDDAMTVFRTHVFRGA